VKDFEILVIDDGSTDGGGDIALSIDDSRVRVIQQINSGVSAARNAGIEKAKSNLIAFLDADDEWKSDFLETILDLANKYPHAGAYATAYEICTTENMGWIPRFLRANQNSNDFIIPNYFSMAIDAEFPLVWSSAVAVSRHVFKQLGGFAVDENFGEDLDMWGRIAFFYPIAWSAKVSATYWRDDSNSICNTHVYDENIPFVNSVIKLLVSGEGNMEQMDALKEYVAFLQIERAKELALFGNKKVARRILKKTKTRALLKRKLWWLFWSWMPCPVIAASRKIKIMMNNRKAV
jgi:glycosyltransferase involved in cell wall biosynthesis